MRRVFDCGRKIKLIVIIKRVQLKIVISRGFLWRRELILFSAQASVLISRMILKMHLEHLDLIIFLHKPQLILNNNKF